MVSEWQMRMWERVCSGLGRHTWVVIWDLQWTGIVIAGFH